MNGKQITQGFAEESPKQNRHPKTDAVVSRPELRPEQSCRDPSPMQRVVSRLKLSGTLHEAGERIKNPFIFIAHILVFYPTFTFVKH